MGKHHTQLHCQLFTMEMAALPQVMPQTTGRQLSQLAGATPTWESSGPHRGTTAGSHTSPSLPSHAQSREAPPSRRHHRPPHQWGRSSASPVAPASRTGKCCTCKETQPRGWRAAAGPALLHRSGSSCSLSYTGTVSLQGSILGHSVPVHMLQKCLVSSPVWLPGHRHQTILAAVLGNYC